jgi:uncharacterized membrane protein
MLNLKYFLIHLFHILIIGSLFLYVGIQQAKILSITYPFLIFLGIFLIIYQTYKGYLGIKAGKFPWVSLFHIVIVAPLLLLIGIYGVDSPRYLYELLLMLGFAAIGYHGYYLFQSI